MNTHIQLEELKSVMQKTKDRRHFERYQAVYLYLSGYNRKQISEIITRNPVTVGIYIKAYNLHSR